MRPALCEDALRIGRILAQDCSRRDRLLIQRGLAALERAELLGGALGPYALQAAIVACHARARMAEETDWARIAALYETLAQLTPSPVVELNRAVADAMAYGPEEARNELEPAASLTRNARERELLLERAAACARGMLPPR